MEARKVWRHFGHALIGLRRRRLYVGQDCRRRDLQDVEMRVEDGGDGDFERGFHVAVGVDLSRAHALDAQR